MAIKLFIGLPSGDTWHADTSIAFVNMCLWLQKATIDFAFYNVRSSILPDSRNKLVELAQELEATHLLFIDSDMIYPKDTPLRLLKHHVDIVAANCVTRSRPANTTARLLDGSVYYPTRAEGLTEVKFVGTGVMLINMAVFTKLEKPHFLNKWLPETQQIVGEDWYFLDKAREAGFRAFVDDSLSWNIRHIGVYPHSFDDVDYPPDKWKEMQEYLTDALRKSSELHTGP